MKFNVFTLAAASLFAFTSVHAGEGDIDTGYGQQGYARSDAYQLLGGSDNYLAPASVPGPGDSVYLVGTMAFEQGTQQRGYVARVRPDGTLDTNFAGGAGLLSLDFVQGDYSPRAGVMAPDGGVVVIGLRAMPGGVWPTICKLTASGDADVGFGAAQTPGCRTLDWRGSVGPIVMPDSLTIAPAVAIASAPGGGYVVAFDYYNEQSNTYAGLARLGASGDVDIGFGSNGLSTSTAGHYIAEVAVRENGEIVLA